jgi:tetratricopeptide (TPR) repeat protein
MRRAGLLLMFLSATALSGCGGEVAAWLALAAGAGIGAWMVGRDRRVRALHEGEQMRNALTSGQSRELEFALRRRLALKAAGEAVSAEREWLARAQLGGLLVAEWRLDEAERIYAEGEGGFEGALALARFGRHELAVLRGPADEARLRAIRDDAEQSMSEVPRGLHEVVRAAWRALEGLCLARMDRPRDAVEALEAGLPALTYNPARVVYLFHLAHAHEALGEVDRAQPRYDEAARAFPGTRLANEAQARVRALAAGETTGFRAMLPPVPAVEAGRGGESEPE